MLGRLYLTENCNASCKWCFNKETRDSSLNMDTNKAKKLIDFLAENGVSKLLIMGGEPTIHPDFVEIWNYTYNKFKYITLYTNGTQKEKLKQIKVNKKNGINYNFNFINKPLEYDERWNGISFEIVITYNTNIKDLTNRIIKCYSDKICLVPTIDCTFDIKYKTEIQSKLSKFFDFIIEHPEYKWGFDHTYPRCILNSELMNKGKQTGINKQIIPDVYERNLCSSLIGDSGLILSNFKLVHCNQYRKNYLDLFNSEGNICVSMEDIKEFLKEEGISKLKELIPHCTKCMYFPDICNGGCIGNKLFNNGLCTTNL